MSKYKNTQKTFFLKGIPSKKLDDDDEPLSKRCKFNFHYLDQTQAHTFSGLTDNDKIKLWNALKDFSEKSLDEWKISKTLIVYNHFPSHSKFSRPNFVPHGVEWARFRLTGRFRLGGFIIPKSLDGTVHNKTKLRFDSNCFYIVFIDLNHEFYPVKKKNT